MKILYWNINKTYSHSKQKWIESSMLEIDPDIFCIAEGPESIPDCLALIDFFNKNGYNLYYSPTLYSEPVISNQYGWNKFGLKIFTKNTVSLKSRFSFGNQKLEGRIVYLRFKIINKIYSLFLIHGMSKNGDELNQNDFVVELTQFIMTKTLNREEDEIIVMGDFNIEPWEHLLKKRKYIYSFFYKKQHDYYLDRMPKRIFSNPSFEYIQQHKDENLIGTFYNDNFISLFDYPLLSKGITNSKFEIITEIAKDKLLIKNNSKHLLVDGFDHLPITLKI